MDVERRQFGIMQKHDTSFRKLGHTDYKTCVLERKNDAHIYNPYIIV